MPDSPTPAPTLADMQAAAVADMAAAVDLVQDHPGVEHIWLNAMSCIRPSDAFAAEVGRMVIAKVMSQRHEDVLRYNRHVVLRINAS